VSDAVLSTEKSIEVEIFGDTAFKTEAVKGFFAERPMNYFYSIQGSRNHSGLRSCQDLFLDRISQPSYKALTGRKVTGIFLFICEKFIDGYFGPGTCHEAIVIEDHNSAFFHSRIKKVAAVQHRLINIHVYMGQAESFIFYGL
jgi:hypothetical protein